MPLNTIILEVSENITIALITGAVGILTSLIGAIGAFQISAKKDRDKQREDLKAELIKYHEKNREEIKKIQEGDLKEIREDVTSMGANLQQKIAIIEMELGHTRNDITTLSARVEKHNNVIERTYRLEETDKLLDEKIKVANHRIDAEIQMI